MNSRSLKQRTRAGYGSSPYRGVSWNTRSGKWKGEIRLPGGNKGLGYYATELDALEAVNAAYAEHFLDYPELQQKPIEPEKPLHSIISQRWICT